MAHKLLKQLLVFVAAVLTGCTPDYAIVVAGGGTETIYETIYEEVEVPVYIYEEVPTEPETFGLILLFSLKVLTALIFCGLLILPARWEDIVMNCWPGLRQCS